MSEILETSETVDTSTPTDTVTSVVPTAPLTTKPQALKRDEKPRGKREGGFKDEPKEFAEELLAVDRVTRVTAGGRQLRFRASVVI